MKQQEIPGGYDQKLYVTERISVNASDGAVIFISLVYKNEVTRTGNNPLLLYGYGSYGISSDATFDSKRFSLIDRGVIFAIAHIRGGGELGRQWYESGKFLHKKKFIYRFYHLC